MPMFSWLASLFRRQRPTLAELGWPLNGPLFAWDQDVCCTLGQSMEGTLVLGATGSGKSSGSGRALALAMLGRGEYGGLVLTAKADERRAWEHYCRDTGRLDDLIVIEPGGEHRWNVLDGELSGNTSGAFTLNIVALLMLVLEKAQGATGGGGGGGHGENKFWADAARQLITNAVEILLLAKGRVQLPDLHRFILSAPQSVDQLRSEEWKAQSLCARCLAEAEQRPKNASQQADFELAADYLLLEYTAMNPKTRSTIISLVTSMLDPLMRGVARDLFCSDSTFSLPEAVLAGKIVLIDLPVLTYRETGTLAQVLVKTAFQRAIQRRNVNANPRPAFLWADEAQLFTTSMDAEFLATCRSARIATVFLTQNVGNVRAALGDGDRGRSLCDALFANLNTKIFHANSDPVTNEWASQIIGRSVQMQANSSVSAKQDWVESLLGICRDEQTSYGLSEHLTAEIEPKEFTTLATGGPTNNWYVEAIVVQSGRVFPDTGTIWRPVAFRQKP